MFLSYAVVPVFVFTILLNFFCLYSPIGSQQLPDLNFTTCEECLESECHAVTNGTCALSLDNSTYLCVLCTTDPSGCPRYSCEETCQESCTDNTTQCVCDGSCYSCVASEGLDLTQYLCTVPIFAVNESCMAIPYAPPPLDISADTSTDTNTDTSTGTYTDTSTGTYTDTSTGTSTDTTTDTETTQQ